MTYGNHTLGTRGGAVLGWGVLVGSAGVACTVAVGSGVVVDGGVAVTVAVRVGVAVGGTYGPYGPAWSAACAVSVHGCP